MIVIIVLVTVIVCNCLLFMRQLASPLCSLMYEDTMRVDGLQPRGRM